MRWRPARGCCWSTSLPPASTPPSLEHVAAKLKELARSGIALLVVEHLMGFIDQITDRIIVMNAGKEIFEGRLAEAVKNPQVVEVFLGAEHAA